MGEEEVGAPVVDRFLRPLPDASAPCGPDLEYDNDFLALSQAAAGKPESQFDAGVPPDWRAVREQSEALLERTRDLRIALLWLRCGLHLDGFGALPQGLRLVLGLLEAHWDTLHPLPDPDDGDPYARMNALAVLAESDGVLGDLRQAVLIQQRGVGEVRVRSVEIALNMLQPREGEAVLSRGQISQMLAEAVEQQPALRLQPQAAIDRVKALTALMNERAGVQGAPDLKPLLSLLVGIAGLMPVPAEAADGAAEGATADGAQSGTGPRLSGGVNSRDDAVRALDMVCAYLERAEPTNPAPLLLRRARRLISHNFLQLMKELAPDALDQVARVMGVDPSTVQIDDAS